MRNQRKQRVQHVIVCVLVCVMLLSMVTPISAQAATYQKGSKGTSVKFLQQNLTFLGFSTGGIDGAFGNNTRKAVMELQKALQFEQTGIVDNGLNQLITDAVSDIQKYLKYKGYYTGIIDGICGNGTKNALKKLQKEKGKAQTGFTDYSILIDIINDVTSGVEMKTLREWVARLNGSYSVTLESEYYEKYGEDYIKLFTEYPELLEADEIFSFLNYSSSYAKILQEEAKEEYTKASVWEGFVNGTEVIVKEILSSFGVGKNLVDQTTYDSIMALVSNMYYKDNAIYETMKKTEEAINQFGDIYSLAEGNSKATLAIEIVKENPDLSLEGVEKVLDTVTENWSGISKELDKGITATEYIVAMIQLYAMTGEFMEELQSVVKQPSVLYSDIEYLKQERERDLEEFLINELAAHGAVELVEELLSLATGGKYEMITEGLDFVSQYTVTATAYEQVHTLLFEAYCENLKDTISIMRADFLNNGNLYITSEWVEKISNYETAYEFYLCAIETYYESVTGLANSYEKTAVEQRALIGGIGLSIILVPIKMLRRCINIIELQVRNLHRK